MGGWCAFRRVVPVLATLALGFGTVASARADDDKPDKFEKLSGELRRAYGESDYKKALELAQKMHELRPDDPDPLYNMACMNSLLGNKKAAYEALEQAIEAGYDDVNGLVNDYDLRRIRGEARFRQLVQRLREHKHKAAGEDGEKKARKHREDESTAQDEDEESADDHPQRKSARKSPGRKAAQPDDADGGEKDESPALTPAQRRAKVAELTRKVLAAAEADNIEEALKYAQQALKLQDVGLTNYNVACMEARLGQKDKAFRHLARAAELGFGPGMDFVRQMEGDSDLKSLRKDPRYKEILAQAKEKWGGQEEEESDGKPARKKPSDREASRRRQAEQEEEETAKSKRPKKSDAKSEESDEESVGSRGEKSKKGEAGDARSAATRRMKVNDLTEKLIEAAGKGELEDALAYAEQALKLEENGLTQYNVACMHARLGHKDEAFEHLEKAAELGFPTGESLTEQMKTDSDMDSLRGDARYKKILEKMGKESSDGAGDEEPRRKQPPQASSPAKHAPSPRPRSGGESGSKAGKTAKIGKTVWGSTVVMPPNYNTAKKWPVLVVLPEPSQGADEAVGEWSEASRKIGAILMVVRRTERNGEASADGGSDLDVSEDMVMDAIDSVIDQQSVDEEKIVLAGVKQSADAAWGLAMRRPKTFRGLISVGGMPKPVENWGKANVTRLHVVLIAGDRAERDLLASNRKAARQLREAGAEVKLQIYEDVDRGFPENKTEEQVKALKFVLGSE